MKLIKKLTAQLFLGSLLFSSCATIFGGTRYNAHVVVNNRPSAKIVYQGEIVGTGSTMISVKRKEANKFSFIVKEDGCEEQKYNFKYRTFRGWALFGSIITWTVSIDGIPVLPAGVIIDWANGAYWKPNAYEKGIIKQNYKNYKYLVDYTNSCKLDKPSTVLDDLLYLKNGKIIRGQIIEAIPNERIQIRLLDGNIELYQYSEIEKTERRSQNNK
jgi:hypothetical protein